jgi:excisionase family DNA binding protein
MTSSDSDKRAALLREIQPLIEEVTTSPSARLFSATQVAMLFGVSERTVRIWANKNWIPAIRTPGGHWKFPARQIAQVYKKGLQQGKFQLQNV